MAPKSNAYWRKRANARMEYYHRSSDKTINTVTRAYDRAIEDINREIQDIFERYSDNGMLSNQEARTILNTPISRTEIDDLKNTITTIKDERIKKQLISRINAPAYAARITRLQALKEKIYIESKKIADIEISSDTSGFMDTINNAYYRTMFDIQKGVGVGFDVAAMPSSTIESILKNPWSGKHFSERVWGNTDVLAGKLTEIVTSGMMSGKSIDKMAKELEYMSNVGKHAAARIIRTETTYIANAAEMESYKEAKIDKYIFIATLDFRTSDICREHDNNVYEVNKAVPGENMPPLHPNCRSTTIAYFDEETLSSIERRALDPESGKDYKVPANMKYGDWKDIFVNKTKSYNDWQNSQINGIINIDNWKGLNYQSSYTKQQAINRLKTEYGINFVDSRKYPMDEGLMNDCVGWLDSFSSNYNSFMKNNPCKIPTISNNAPSKMGNSVGYYRHYINSSNVVELALNSIYHSNVKLFQNYVDKCISIKWYPANATVHKTFVHEFGHHVSNSMRWITGDANWQHTFIEECIDEFKKVEPNYTYKTYIGMKDYVSEYGATSESELFAEAFAEYFGGENPREFAKIFGKKLEVILEGVK